MLNNIKNFRRIKADSVINKNKETEVYLLRGGPLDNINDSDKEELINDCNLTTVIDFRSSSERVKAPNKNIDFIDFFNVEILDPQKSILKNPIEFFKEYEKSQDLSFMERLYGEFVLSKHSRESFKEFLDIVSKSEGSVYFHCTAGKDRTGFAALLLLEILGAKDQEIYKDYLKTNESIKDDYAMILNILRESHEYEVDDIHLKDLIGVKSDYLNTSLNLINNKYGSVMNYIEDGLNVDQATLDLIREKFSV